VISAGGLERDSAESTLTATIGNQSKTYGANDPSLSGITPTLAGVVNNPAVVTWNGNVAINDTGQVAASLASLTRTVGENVATSPYAITAGTLNALTGTSAGNYSAIFSLANSPTLAINQATLTATIGNQSKTYGANDPSLSGITPTLAGVVNNPAVVTWNGNVAINDTGQVAASLASLTRTANENVGSYNITGGALNALTGTSASNYTASFSTSNSPVLAINAASLTASISNQSKTYGADDPSLSGITPALSGVINRTVSTWNGNVVVNDTNNVSASVASLTRATGENVGFYSITGGTLNALTGTSAGNYTASLSTAGNTLAVTAKALTASITDQSKTYGADDPSLSGITPTLSGVVNATVTDWNGTSTLINDTGKVMGNLQSLMRTAGENVGSYNVTGGTLSR
jgi:hypothetical protein